MAGSTQRRRGQKIWLGVAISLTGILLVAVICLGIVLRPIERGTAADFWYAAAGVKIGPCAGGDFGRPAVHIGEDQCFCQVWGMEYSVTHVVPTSEIKSTIEQACSALAKEDAKGDPNWANWWPAKGYAKWLNDPDVDRNSVEALVEKMREGFNEMVLSRGITSGDGQQMAEHLLEWQIAQVKWDWVNFVFEFFLLSGLVGFVLWAGIKGGGAKSWSWRLGLLPVLLMLPCWMGYGTAAVDSRHPGPGMRILYPWILLTLPAGHMNPVDIAIVQHIPPVLAPMSYGGQWHVSLLSMLADSGGQHTMWGPTYTVGFGAVLGVSVLVVAGFVRRVCAMFGGRKGNDEAGER